MKSNCYASIDAHIIRCRLHHYNNLSYAVALKSGKTQQVTTPFKPSQQLIIEMDTHLILQADKHAYQQFPKLTLIVNVMGENQEQKTVGTTFANFRKEGVQTFQVSECSCKDKAFEVDISFSCKVEPKSSNNSGPKKQIQSSTKPNYLSHQVTPRQSRELQSQLINQQKSPLGKVSPIKETSLHQVRSEKVLGKFKESQVSLGENKNTVQSLRGEIAALNLKLSLYETEIQDLKRYKKMLFQEQLNSQKWFELLKLEEEKSSCAMSHILSLEEMILNLVTKFKPEKNNSSTSFRIIQEEDQLVLMNEELQNELEKQKAQNQTLREEICSLNLTIATLTIKLQQSEENIKKLEIAKEHSKIKSQISLIESPNEIMITSRVQEKNKDNEKTNFLEKQIEKLEIQYQALKTQITNLQQTKKKILKETKPRPQVRKTVSSKAEQPKKPARVNSKEKNSKPPNPRNIKKNLTTNGSATVVQSKKVEENKPNDAEKKTKVSSEAESKTEGGESINKSSQFEGNEMKSQTSKPVINEAFYMANTFQEEVKEC